MSFKVSVIVPVYNCINYLADAVNSVIGQDCFGSVELILVDDGSSDGSSELCDKFSEDYDNIVAVHQPNAGVSAARNHGMEISHGEYIAFLDSDDRYEDGFISQMLQKGDSDVVCCDYYCRDVSEKNLGNLFADGEIKENFFDYDFMKKIISPSFYSCWNKLYKKEIIDKYYIQFPIGIKYAEDMQFVFEYLKHCKSFCFIDKPLYFYNVNPDNATSVVHNGFDVFLSIYEWQKTYFFEMNADRRIFEDILDVLVYKATCAINSDITYSKGFSSCKTVKRILNNETFYKAFCARYSRNEQYLYDKVFHALIKQKNVFGIIIWRKLFDLRSKLANG